MGLVRRRGAVLMAACLLGAAGCARVGFPTAADSSGEAPADSAADGLLDTLAEQPAADHGAEADAGADLADGAAESLPDSAPDSLTPPVVGPPGVVCSDGWCWEHPSPHGAQITALWCSSPSDLYAGSRTVLAHFDGTSWRQVVFDQPPTAGVLDIWGSGASDVHAAVLGEQLLHFDGSTWQWRHAGASSAQLIALWGFGPSSVYAAGYAEEPPVSLVVRFDGSSWTTLLASGEEALQQLWGSSESDLFAAGVDDLLHFDGSAWSAMAAPHSGVIYDLWGSGPTDVYFLAFADVHRYDGTSWQVMPTPGAGLVHGIWGRSASEIYVARTFYEVLRYDGSAWDAEPMPASNQPYVVHGCGDTTFAGAGRGAVFARPASGPWQLLSQGPHVDILGIWGDGQTAVAVGWGGTVLERDATTQAWTLVPAGTPHPLYAIGGPAADDLYAVGDGGTIVHHDGTSWITVASEPLTSLRALRVDAAGGVIAVGARNGGGGLAVHLTPAWQRTLVDQPHRLHAVWGASATAVWAVGEGGEARFFDGTTWSGVPLPTSAWLGGMWGISAQQIYAVGGDGTVLRFDGTSWIDAGAAGGDHDYRAIHGSGSQRIVVVGDQQLLRYDGTSWTPEPAPVSYLKTVFVGPTYSWIGGNAGILRAP